MGVARRIIFPTLRLMVWAVIAVALCVLAFGDRGANLSTSPTEGPYPHSNFTDPVITATTQSLENTIGLSGTISPEPAAEVKAGGDGRAVYFAMPSGDWVERGAPLLTLRHTVEREPLERVDEFGNVRLIAQSPITTESTVVATATGRITFLVSLNDEVSAGSVLARISSEEFFIEAQVEPVDLYRLVNLPETATATIANGPEPFECTELRFISDTGADEELSTKVRCEIPEEVKVFPGLSVSLSITTSSVADAVVLPITAVRGSFESGSVWLVGADGEPAETAVQLGITDGTVIQILAGISAGDEVLEFVPSTPPIYPGGGMEPGDIGWEDFSEGEYPEGEFPEDEYLEGEYSEDELSDSDFARQDLTEGDGA